MKTEIDARYLHGSAGDLGWMEENDTKAEIEELKQQKRNCMEIIDDDAKEIAELKAEVERLRRAVEIAEKIWADCSNGSEHTELAALKEEIK
jgi:predicted RNase H-like nuclease (RuvC/YqgF family)